MESRRPVVHPQQGRGEKNIPFANMQAENKKKTNQQTKKKPTPVPTFAGCRKADPGPFWVGGCSLLYEMFSSAGAICILSLAPVSSKEGESSLRDQLPFKINY